MMADEGWTRRDVLQRIGAGLGQGAVFGALAALGIPTASARDRPPDLKGGRGRSVLILGAGLAGLTAAYELSRAGYACRILEARERVGGRCWTLRRGDRVEEEGGLVQDCRFDPGLYYNMGPWRIPYHHTSTLHYTRELKVPLEIFVNANEAAFVYRDGQSSLGGDRPVRQVEVVADMRGYTAEILAKAIDEERLDGLVTREEADILLDYLVKEAELSASDLGYRGGDGRGFDLKPGAGLQGGEGQGPGVPAKPFSLEALLRSRAWEFIHSVAPYNHPATMFQAKGGMDALPKAFLPEVGHLIDYDKVVTRIVSGPEGVTVDHRDRRDASVGRAEADYCLCTLPIPILRTVENDFPRELVLLWDLVWYHPAARAALQMRRRFWEEDHQIYGGSSVTNIKGVDGIYYPSYGFQAAKGIVTGYYQVGEPAVVTAHLDPRQRIDFALNAGEKVHPGAYRESFETGVAYAWQRIPFSHGAWANWNAMSRAAAYQRLYEPAGRVYFAGEHMSYLSGWMAGAIESAWLQIERLHQRAVNEG